MSDQREPGVRHSGQAQQAADPTARRRRQQARATLVAIARTEGLQWLLREVQVLALWSAPRPS